MQIRINDQPATLVELAALAASARAPWTCTCGQRNRGKDLVCLCGVRRPEA